MVNIVDLFENKVLVFLDNIFHQTEILNIDLSKFELDHICYRVQTEERYNLLKSKLLIRGELISEDVISNRKISNFRLNSPIAYQNRKISIIELPAAKQNSFYQEGFEHVEFVVPYPLEKFESNNPNINFDKTGYFKKVNRDLRLNLGKYSVKFHEKSLVDIIQLEQKTRKEL